MQKTKILNYSIIAGLVLATIFIIINIFFDVFHLVLLTVPIGLICFILSLKVNNRVLIVLSVLILTSLLWLFGISIVMEAIQINQIK